MKKCKLVQNIMNFKFCYIIFCTIICSIVLSVPTFAKENSDNVIRVGSFEETYNTVNEKCKLCLNGMPVPLLRNCYSIFNGTKYR